VECIGHLPIGDNLSLPATDGGFRGFKQEFSGFWVAFAQSNATMLLDTGLEVEEDTLSRFCKGGV